MSIIRINTYDDQRFSQEALNQHGCYIADGEVPVEIIIISQSEALIKGDKAYLTRLLKNFDLMQSTSQHFMIKAVGL